MTKKIYAYLLLDENTSGIIDDWDICKNIIHGKKSRYKSFATHQEAKEWLASGGLYEKKKHDTMIEKNAVYFDAGTGRGNGVEIRISDYKGISLLFDILPKNKINDYGNYYLSSGRTNNFGELTGLYAALQYALKYNVKKIFGDSRLVIDYWSKSRYNKNTLDQDTIDLISKVSLLRKEFEQNGGEVNYISGDINPADLGFHK